MSGPGAVGGPEARSPFERAVDLLVYAPLGLALTAREELPRLISKGREMAGGQVGMARMIGQFTVDQGQRQAGKLLRQAGERMAGRLADLGVVPDAGRDPRPASPSAERAGDGPVPPVPPRPQEASPSGKAPSAESLAIPGYDSLSAPQVVQRLDGLSEAELESVRTYEAATRRRKTILSRVAQLQSAT